MQGVTLGVHIQERETDEVEARRTKGRRIQGGQEEAAGLTLTFHRGANYLSVERIGTRNAGTGEVRTCGGRTNQHGAGSHMTGSS